MIAMSIAMFIPAFVNHIAYRFIHFPGTLSFQNASTGMHVKMFPKTDHVV